MGRERLAASVAVATMVMVLFIMGCSDDCPICPKPPVEQPYQGRLYVCMLFGTSGVFVVDTQTDSVLDSIVYDRSAMTVSASDDGRYLAVGDDHGTTRAYDAATLRQLPVTAPLIGLEFLKESNALFGVGRHSFYKYSVPDFGLIFTGTTDLDVNVHRYVRSRDLLILAGDTNRIVVVDTDSFRVRKDRRIWAPNGEPYTLWRLDGHPNGDLVYAIGIYSRSVDLICYSLDSGKILNLYPMYTRLGEVRVSPKGDKVYVTDPGIPGMHSYNPGNIFVFDAYTGEYLHGISLVGYVAGFPWEGLDAWQLEFSPDGSILYVSTGHSLSRAGTVLKINTKTDAIEKVIFPEINRWPRRMAVGPVP